MSVALDGRPVHVSLFSGVGMTDLAAEAEGFQTIATAEVDVWNREVLAQRFPDATHFHDVKHVTSTALRVTTGYLGRVDLLSGGFPCQDASSAGPGTGLDGARTGLWKEFLRIIEDLRPHYVLGENVAMLRSRGLGRILYDLWNAGYDVRWECIPAAYVGAPHLRDRVWIMARRVETVGGFDAPDHEQFAEAVDFAATTKLPRAGRMVNGKVYGTTPLTTPKKARESLLSSPSRCEATPTGAWPTPNASVAQDGEGPATWLARREVLKAKGTNGNGAGMPLTIAVQLFPTPTKQDGANNGGPAQMERNSLPLNAFVRMYPTPTKSDGSGGPGTTPKRTGGKNLRTVVNDLDGNGRLNPAWVEWLMGLPWGWTDPETPNALLIKHSGFPREPAGIDRTASKSVPYRPKRLKALGNGLVPQVARVALRILIDS